MKKRLSFQQCRKRIEKACQLCGESNYDVLDVHRIVPATEGGKYRKHNTLCICCHCHRRIHAGEIVIEGKYKSTGGEVVHFFDNGEEIWKGP